MTLFLCAVIFIAGLVAGYGLAIVAPPPFEPEKPASMEERCARLTDRIDSAVGLRSQQREQVRAIVGERLRSMRETIYPLMGAEARRLDEQIRQILQPDQLPAWEAYFNERFSRFTQPPESSAPATQPAGD
jgi:hypothetical protein